MKNELPNADFEIYHIFVLQLLKFYEVPVANDLVGAMSKTKEKNRLPIFYSCVTHFYFNKAAAKFQRQISVKPLLQRHATLKKPNANVAITLNI